MRPARLLLWTLVALVPLSALAVVWAEHESRTLFVKLETLTRERDALNVEWGQLQLEQTTLATHGRVEELAARKLHMRLPSQESVVVVSHAPRTVNN